MEESTLHLAQLIGPVLLLLGLSFVLKREAYHKLFKKMYKDTAFLFITAIVELTAGVAIVLSHNLWNTLPEVLISLLGWGAILEGGLVLLNDKVSIKKMYKIMTPGLLLITALITLVAGGYLCWLGYLA